MQNNPYNLISFQTDAYTSLVDLQITPAPDRLLRVFKLSRYFEALQIIVSVIRTSWIRARTADVANRISLNRMKM